VITTEVLLEVRQWGHEIEPFYPSIVNLI